MLEHMQIYTIRATFSAMKEGRLPPYLGSTIRGLLGHCMRDFVCKTHEGQCHLCGQKEACSYARCFCSPGNEGGAVNPYVLHVLSQGKTQWSVGDLCRFDLTLIGRVTQDIGLFLDALRAMETRGWGVERIPFQLEFVENPTTRQLLYASGETWLRNLQPDCAKIAEHVASAALVRFDTPVRILESKVLCRVLPFSVLIRSLSRRISLLSQAYTGCVVEWDEESMLEAARHIQTKQESWRFVDFKRYSMNQDTRSLRLESIDGWALYEGDLTPFVPILEAGRILHAGKNATIGFGHYEVSYDSRV